MSKGTIASGGTDGDYNVTVEREDGSNETVQAWCADLTEDLSGEVGVIEIAGDIDKGVNVQPGHEGNAVYDETRDGKMSLVPQTKESQPASGVYWNWAMRAGWQKWRPNYRYGTITAIDAEADTCDVTLDECLSTDTPDGESMDLNQIGSLSDVDIEYMSCNAGAFAVGDEVVVKFEGFDWASPKVIGFKEEPKRCFGYMVVEIGSRCFVWDFKTESVAEDVHIDGDPETMAEFPIETAHISNWQAEKTSLSFDTLFSKETVSGAIPTEEITTLSEYNENYVCEGGEGHEEYGSSTLTEIDGEITTDLGRSVYDYDRTASGDYYVDCPEEGTEYYKIYEEQTTVEETSYYGFILTALNESDDKTIFKVKLQDNYTKSLSYRTDGGYGIVLVGRWGYESSTGVGEAECTSSSFTFDQTESLTPTVPYFTISPKSRTASYGCGSDCDAVNATCTPIGTNDPAISIELDITHAGYYSEDYGVLTQLFVYKDDAGNYHGYGTADSGLNDVSVAPSGLSEKADLSSALQSLAEEADGNSMSVIFYN